MRNIFFLLLLAVGCKGEAPKAIQVTSDASDQFNGVYTGFVSWVDFDTERTHQSPYTLKVEDGDVNSVGFSEVEYRSELKRDSVQIDSVTYQYSDFYFTNEIRSIQIKGQTLDLSTIIRRFDADSLLQETTIGRGELKKIK